MTVAELSRAIASSSTPLAVLEDGHAVVACNQALADLVGVPSPDALLGPPMAWVPPERWDAARHGLRDLSERIVLASTSRGELRGAGGEVLPVIVSGTAVSLSEGSFVLIALNPSTDGVTPPPVGRPAELAIVVADHDWRITHVTGSADELFAGAEPVVGSGLLGLVHPDDAAPFLAAISGLDDVILAASIPLQMRSGAAWRRVLVHVSRLCSHNPPRLVCLLSGDVEASTASAEPVRLLESSSHHRRLLADLGHLIHNLPEGRELSGQHWEIVVRALQGESPAEIARGMFLSRGTVRNGLAEIYRLFGVHSQVELMSRIFLASQPPPTLDDAASD